MANTSFDVIQANFTHVAVIAPLFDSYRQFYGQTTDLAQAHNFLLERLTKQESVILIAVTHDTQNCLGFTQLYPSFSSVAMQRIWILNDLFVASTVRNCGVGTALLNAVKEFARTTNAQRIALATAIDNYPAQKLYEKVGYTKNTAFEHYQLTL